MPQYPTCRKLLLLILLALTTGAAHAADDRRTAALQKLRAKFDAADTDHDGRLTFAEIAGYIAAARAGRK